MLRDSIDLTFERSGCLEWVIACLLHEKNLSLTPRCHATILFRFISLINGSIQSSSSSVTAGSPRS